jgi:hypothetical protein
VTIRALLLDQADQWLVSARRRTGPTQYCSRKPGRSSARVKSHVGGVALQLPGLLNERLARIVLLSPSIGKLESAELEQTIGADRFKPDVKIICGGVERSRARSNPLR